MKKLLVIALVLFGLSACAKGGLSEYSANNASPVCQDYIMHTRHHLQCPRIDQELLMPNMMAARVMCKCGRKVPAEIMRYKR